MKKLGIILLIGTTLLTESFAAAGLKGILLYIALIAFSVLLILPKRRRDNA